MGYEAFFSDDTEILGKARRFRLVKLSGESPAAVLQSEDGAEFLLGDMRIIAPDLVTEPGEAECEALGVAPGAEVAAFCRVLIPQDAPMDAGFDTSRLILIAPESGRAVEVRRPGGPLISLKR